MIAGTLNIVYGIGALDNANIFTNDTRYIFTDLNTMGWVLIVLGIIQLTGGFSLMAGNTYGRVLGIVGASLGAIGALFSIGGANPWWSLAIFALCLYIIQGIAVLGEDERAPRADPRRAAVRSAVLSPPGQVAPWRDSTGRRRVNRERAVRTLTFWLRPEFVLRVVNRFQKVAGFDRSIALASGALTATIPLTIVASALASTNSEARARPSASSTVTT